MTDIPKRLKRLLRTCAGEAHEEELRRALVPLAEAFDRWKRGDIASSELSNLIHEFHQGPPRELFVKYNTNHLEAPVAHAIVTGVLDKDKIPSELVEHLAAWIKFYEIATKDGLESGRVDKPCQAPIAEKSKEWQLQSQINRRSRVWPTSRR